MWWFFTPVSLSDITYCFASTPSPEEMESESE